jgi:hypothetical protein
MPVRVFLSHSVAPSELALVNGVADAAAQRGAIPAIPDRAWNPSVEELPDRIKAQIRESAYLIAIASQWGQHVTWLNQEVTYSRQLSPPRPSVVVADAQIEIPPGHDCIRMDRANPLATLAQVSQHIQRLVQDQQTQALLRGLLIGGLALLFLRGR